MADNIRQESACPGDCKQCSIIQHSYCAAQMARNTQDMVARLASDVDSLNKRLDELFHGEIVTPPAAGDVPASDAHNEAVQTIGPDDVSQSNI